MVSFCLCGEKTPIPEGPDTQPRWRSLVLGPSQVRAGGLVLFCLYGERSEGSSPWRLRACFEIHPRSWSLSTRPLTGVPRASLRISLNCDWARKTGRQAVQKGPLGKVLCVLARGGSGLIFKAAFRKASFQKHRSVSPSKAGTVPISRSDL